MKLFFFVGIESISETMSAAFTDKTNKPSESINKQTDEDKTIFEGKATLKVVRAKELEKKDLIGKSDPYVVIKYRGKF